MPPYYNLYNIKFDRLLISILSLIFLTSSLLKFVSLNNFISENELVFKTIFPHNLITPISILFLVYEFTLGIILFINFMIKISIHLAILTIIFFIIINITRLFISPQETCGCFGEIINLKIIDSLALDIFMLIISFFVMRRTNNRINMATSKLLT